MTEVEQKSGSSLGQITQELRGLTGKTEYDINPLVQLMDVYKQSPNFVVPLLLTNHLVLNEITKTFYTTLSYEDGKAILDSVHGDIEAGLANELDEIVEKSAKTIIDSVKEGKSPQLYDFYEELLFGKFGNILTSTLPEVRKAIRTAIPKGDQSFKLSLKHDDGSENKQSWRLDYRVAQLFGNKLGIPNAKSILPVASDRREKEDLKKDQDGEKRREKIRNLARNLNLERVEVGNSVLGNVQISFEGSNKETAKEDIKPLARLIAEDFSIFYLKYFDHRAWPIEGDFQSDFNRTFDSLYCVVSDEGSASPLVASIKQGGFGGLLKIDIPATYQSISNYKAKSIQSLHKPPTPAIEKLGINQQLTLMQSYAKRLDFEKR